ncbi:MAG: c-type cytochrome biogenesis protein CcmI [Kordiimonadaceae bacterium]|nr:c-type cytochrome biogenesis protein CcmI [Kordiimonadaceae bacterium]
MIWFGLLLLAIVFMVVFMLHVQRNDVLADPVSLYKKQIADLETDQASGILEADVAVAARLEIERRILRVTPKTISVDAETGGVASGSEQSNLANLPLLVSVGMLLMACLFYAQVGRPTVAAAPGRMANLQDELVEEGGPSFGEALQSIEAHLAKNPTDIKGWGVLAKSARAVSDYSRAARAFAKFAALEPENTTWRVQELEAYIAMAQGQITPAAKLVLQKLLDKVPDHPAGHYYLGMTRLQADDIAGAKAIWLALADRSASDAPWMAALNERLSGLGVKPPKLSAEQISTVANMSEAERNEFVSGMISRLQARLESQPNDAKGWLMLARSLVAVEGKESAITALTKGLSHVSASQAAELQVFLDKLKQKEDP